MDTGDLIETIQRQVGHENKTYSLGADEAVSFADIAACISEIRGIEVPYVIIPVSDFIAEHVSERFPQPAAAFLSEWALAVTGDELSDVTGDLGRLTGRKPVSYRKYLKTVYDAAAIV